MNKVRIGFIGTGNFARKVHYPALDKIKSAQVVAICDNANPERMDEVSSQYGISGKYTDYRRMVDEADIDAVYAIMRPTYGLADIACDVVSAGKHLFVEKPPALSADELKTMAAAANKAGVNTQVGFNRRYMPVMQAAKRQADERGIISISATFYKHEMKGDWFFNRKLMSNGIHAVDSLRWLAGSEPKDVIAMADKAGAEWDNSWHALIRFENGVVGSLLTNYSAGARSHTFEIHARGYSAFVDPDTEAKIYLDGNAGKPMILDAKEYAGSDEFIEHYGIRAEDEAFIASIVEGKQSGPDFTDAVKSMQLVERIEAGGL